MHGDGGAAMSAAVEVRPALMGHLKDLRLPTVRECYEDTARRAERETLSYEQYLLEVVSRECEQRRKSRVQRRLKDSALPLEKSLQNFDLKRLPAKAARQLRTLLEGSFLDRKENVPICTTAAERLGATAGEVAAEFRSEAVAGESGAAVADAAGGQLSGPERERSDLYNGG